MNQPSQPNGPIASSDISVRSLIRAVSRCHWQLAELGDALLADLNMSIAQYDVLALLADTPAPPPTSVELARALHLTAQALNSLATALEANGYIERVALAGVGRKMTINAITNDGMVTYRTATWRLRRAADTLTPAVADDGQPDDPVLLIDLLDRLSHNLSTATSTSSTGSRRT